MTDPYCQDEHVAVHHGDCLDVLATLPDASVDAVVTDPPYGIRFMGRSWDGADIEAATATRRGQASMPDDGRSGTNGGYRSASTEAGRYDLSANAAFGQWCEAWATECLRVLKPGGHMLAFGGSRTWHRLASAVEDAGFEIRDSIAWLYGSGFPKSHNLSEGWQGWGTALKPAFEPIVVGRKPLAGTVAANVLAHGTGALNIDSCRVPGVASLFAGRKRSGGIMGKEGALRDGRPEGHADSGGASRFFPTFRYEAKAPSSERPRVDDIAHPTVKPLALMQWLVRLVTPPGGVVLEPFAGSGTTAEACVAEGFRCIAIEREADYLPLIVSRLDKPIQITLDFGEPA